MKQKEERNTVVEDRELNCDRTDSAFFFQNIKHDGCVTVSPTVRWTLLFSGVGRADTEARQST